MDDSGVGEMQQIFSWTIVSVLSVCVLSSVEEISGSKILFLSTSRRRLLFVRGEIFLDSTVLKSQIESTVVLMDSFAQMRTGVVSSSL